VVLLRSIEDYRRERYMTAEEFASFLGVSPKTYRKIIERHPGVEIPTQRKVAAKIGVPPHVIAELLPRASATYLASLDAAIARANETGWIEGDPETGMPTGRVIHEQYMPDMQHPDQGS
jgi:transcriptional regulator with XRE-family HTH domain